jgi:hypothetical protein
VVLGVSAHAQVSVAAAALLRVVFGRCDGNLAGRTRNDRDDGRAHEPISKVASVSSTEGQRDEWTAKGKCGALRADRHQFSAGPLHVGQLQMYGEYRLGNRLNIEALLQSNSLTDDNACTLSFHHDLTPKDGPPSRLVGEG